MLLRVSIMKSLPMFSAISIIATSLYTDCTPIIFAEKAYHEQHSVLQITKSVFEPAFMFKKCEPNYYHCHFGTLSVRSGSGAVLVTTQGLNFSDAVLGACLTADLKPKVMCEVATEMASETIATSCSCWGVIIGKYQGVPKVPRTSYVKEASGETGTLRWCSDSARRCCQMASMSVGGAMLLRLLWPVVGLPETLRHGPCNWHHVRAGCRQCAWRDVAVTGETRQTSEVTVILPESEVIALSSPRTPKLDDWASGSFVVRDVQRRRQLMQQVSWFVMSRGGRRSSLEPRT
eukprot:TRINITY_DN13857_c1_g1_i1.p1 TRINITY_DN13857_c1_g1~~TRINITY_DN13857_c1_g1_i1.p1  ORF type:complete len:290 (+),score=35.77 TRINITY_DN13857_c1_g1_i1:129-998(+)